MALKSPFRKKSAEAFEGLGLETPQEDQDLQQEVVDGIMHVCGEVQRAWDSKSSEVRFFRLRLPCLAIDPAASAEERHVALDRNRALYDRALKQIATDEQWRFPVAVDTVVGVNQREEGLNDQGKPYVLDRKRLGEYGHILRSVTLDEDGDPLSFEAEFVGPTKDLDLMDEASRLSGDRAA
jgi:hypothetical protein